MTILKGGRTFYGEAIGILMLDTSFPRPPGDIGNATTFDFPVRYRIVRGASPQRVVIEQDPALLEPFIQGARELQQDGVRAITTSCGFLALFQREMAAAVDVPLFTSSLMLMPVVHRMLRPDQKIGVLTANSRHLTPRVLEAVGASGIPYAVSGSQETPSFYQVFVMDGKELDFDEAERGVAKMACDLVNENPDIGAFVCEGTNFSNFAPAVQEATGLAFFDIVTMTRWVAQGVVRRRVVGGFM
ncbi:MAG TPA: aspartate/glutamate racemase family protein [Candidatus Methylomirabilis sp.]|nr:aspartate/glutamate racemase family protein [Candidatus Methylomirabilis sp.]